MEIAAGLTDTEYSTERLGVVMRRIAALLPFDRCLLAHERTGQRGCMTFLFDILQVDHAWTPATEYLQSLSIPRYLDAFVKEICFQRAFVWRAGLPGGDRGLLAFVQRARFDRGVAATVTSMACTEKHEVTTLMQLQCAAECGSEKQLFFANAIVFYMHIFLTHSAWTTCVPCAQRELTNKEREVLLWMAEGKTAWEIGRILAISERTVKFHLHNIYAKFDVANRAQAITVARRLKLA
jgi:LuxR family transcriptional regulator, quorum-sensing system regulator SolR